MSGLEFISSILALIFSPYKEIVWKYVFMREQEHKTILFLLISLLDTIVSEVKVAINVTRIIFQIKSETKNKH